MLLGELIDGDLLERMLGERYVGEQKHPTEPLAILNYTQRCQFDRVWNPVTRQCRGLIYNFETGEIVARPWPKFFNYGEHEEAVKYDLETRRKVYPESDWHFALDPNAAVIVTDKLDGSLGILYREPETGEWAIATRGSFTSEQATHATDVLRRRYAAWLAVEPAAGITYLFEIVFPENRIVVDYGDLDDLVLLGAVGTEDGLPEIAPHFWPGPRAEDFEYDTLAEALEAEPRPNAEGLVVHFLDTNERVKLKQDDYVRLHRIVTGLNERTVWEHLRDDGQLATLLEPLPEEFHQWVRDVAFRLLVEEGRVLSATQGEYDLMVAQLGGSIESIATERRREFAALANASEYRPYLFMLLDGKQPAKAVWKTLRPSHPKTLVDVAEAVA